MNENQTTSVGFAFVSLPKVKYNASWLRGIDHAFFIIKGTEFHPYFETFASHLDVLGGVFLRDSIYLRLPY